MHPLRDVELRLPFEVADYVDFYASEHHAANLGRLLRPGSEPLLPNWKHLPVGYHGRAGTVVVSGTGIMRPAGQRKGPVSSESTADPAPVFGPSVRLDIEAEVGFVVGVGSALGTPVPVTAFGPAPGTDWERDRALLCAALGLSRGAAPGDKATFTAAETAAKPK